MAAMLDPGARPALITFHWLQHQGVQDVGGWVRTRVRDGAHVLIQVDEALAGLPVRSVQSVPREMRPHDIVELDRVRTWARFWVGRHTIIHPADLDQQMRAHFLGFQPTVQRRHGGVIREFL